MAPNRSNLENSQHNSSYIVLSLLFVLLSAAGIIAYFYLNQLPDTAPTDVAPTPTLTPTTVLDSPTPTIDWLLAGSVTPTKKPTPSLKPTITPRPTAVPRLTPYPAGSVTVSITPTTPAGPQTYSSPAAGFSVVYQPVRKVYLDTEASGSRYTFYNSRGNFAIHVGDSWSWSNPDRKFSGDFLVDGHNTFRYDIATQTLVDIENGAKKYTIQCVHNGLADLKTECEAFIKSFKFNL